MYELMGFSNLKTIAGAYSMPLAILGSVLVRMTVKYVGNEVRVISEKLD